ncbi:AcrR family transcriptional regulator [Microbacterium natoriense]|uniref:AcrR family transcriptional regulator n=1 Tax=Microbacterium natoriense TaxID=284570 RepID=A0AAW8ESX0_9MICO|nr:TetR/AcrR family transcriptional regulator [Microbacterium natoriense]MDQ0646588.1 AcrR family transcriptional regulator [Microbacterium natoriense]
MRTGEDRRVRRSKRAIRDAFIELVLEKGFDAVTIEDIVTSADLSRATFYTHYRDKDSLLSDFVSDLALERQRLLPGIEEARPLGFSGLPVRHLFELAARERDAYRIILRGEGNGQALRELTHFLVAQAEETFDRRAARSGVTPRLPIPFVARAWAGEIVGILTWWLDEEAPYDEEELTRFLRDLAVGGRVWASGLDPEHADDLLAKDLDPSVQP